ncbi:MAG: caspase family protein [bacterium]|nr:caspase family protein [bacterium]
MKKYAFLAGVGQYQRRTIAPVHFAVRDVEKIGEVLQQRCGFRTTVLANPSQADFIQGLNDIISFIEHEDDIFFFLFTGHGSVQGNDSYLLFSNAIPGDWVGMYRLEDLQRKFSRLRSHNRLLFLDCCRNDPEAGKSDAAHYMSAPKQSVGPAEPEHRPSCC